MRIVGLITTLLNFAKGAWNFLSGIPGDVGRALSALWSFARAVQQVAEYAMAHPLTELLNALAAFAAVVTGNHDALVRAIARVDPWIYRNRVLPLRAVVIRWFRQLEARIAYLFAQAYLYINIKFRQAEAYARALVLAEHASMIQHFTEAERYAFQQALMRYQAIEREAADTWNAHLHDRLGVARQLADLIATRNPVVRGLVSDLITAIEDLALVDNPVARLALGVVLRQVVNHLAVDRVVATLLSDVLGPLLGRPKARGVADVVEQIAGRLEAVERWQAAFMDDGGPEILQAGEGWKDLTSLLTDAGLLAFMTATIVTPIAAANDTRNVIVPVADAAGKAWHTLLT